MFCSRTGDFYVGALWQVRYIRLLSSASGNHIFSSTITQASQVTSRFFLTTNILSSSITVSNQPLPTRPLPLNQSRLPDTTMFSRKSQTSDRRPSVMSSSTDSSRSSFDSVAAYKKASQVTETEVTPRKPLAQAANVLKNIVTMGGVQKHNPHLALERAIMAQPAPAPRSSKASKSSKALAPKSLATEGDMYDSRFRPSGL